MGLFGFGRDRRKLKAAKGFGYRRASLRKKTVATAAFEIPYGSCPWACRHTRANGCLTYQERCRERGADPVLKS